MKKTGVVCELNPFHKGHERLFFEAKEGGGALVAVMSGNFTQRAECALYGKYDRAKAAIYGGADAVFELPFPFSAAPGDVFARAGVETVVKLGCDEMVFGSECGDLGMLRAAAELTEDEGFLRDVLEASRREVPFAVAREEAVRREAPELAELFGSPNDVLAIEYLKSARKYPHLAMRTVKRIKVRSATEIREAVRAPVWDEERGSALDGVPEYAAEIFENVPMSRLDIFFDIQWSRLTLENATFREPPSDTFDSESGIINRLRRAAGKSFDGDGMFKNAATKKFTDSRLRRAALFKMLHVKKSDLEAPVTSTLLLAADGIGREILSELRRDRECPIRVVTKPSKAVDDESLRLTVSADVFAAMCFRPMIPGDRFLREKPFIKM